MGGVAWLRVPRWAIPGQEPHPQRGPVPTALPRPPGVAAARFQPGWAQCRLSSSGQRGSGASDRWCGRGRWVGRTDVPILLQGAVSGQGRPEGPGRLVEGGAGCKGVPRGVRGRGQGLGRDRAGQGRQGRGRWARGGCPLGVERTGVLQPHTHTSDRRHGGGAGGGRTQVSRGPCGRDDLSLRGPKGRRTRLVAQASGRQRTDRQTCVVPRPCGSSQPDSQFPRLSQLWPPPSTSRQG